jgi:pimeloyl-ACP methyl ester carboxylesterase
VIGPIKTTNLLFVLLVTCLLLAWVYYRLRRKRFAAAAQPAASWPSGFGFVYIARLAGFAILAFLLIGGSLLVFIDYNEVAGEIAAAPSQVKKPADLPFPVESVTFESEKGLRLAGWYTPPKNGAVIILLHGYGGNRLHMIGYAQTLTQAGYGALLYDERASGESGGSRRSFGWEDDPDVGAAIAYLRGRPELARAKLGIGGCSIGAQIALQGAARYPGLQAVWADGPGVIRYKDNPAPATWGQAIAYLSNWIIDPMLSARLGIPAPPAMIDIIGSIAPRPIYLVGGGHPKPYFESESARIYRFSRYAGSNAQVWIIPEATHCDGPQQRPQEYAERLVNFFDQALLK